MIYTIYDIDIQYKQYKLADLEFFLIENIPFSKRLKGRHVFGTFSSHNSRKSRATLSLLRIKTRCTENLMTSHQD